VPFVGVSAHGNTYLFACAFLGDETATTFNWVFSQFLKAMNGKHPRSIITDQESMMKAIKDTFPQTVHRQCWFHVKKNLEEKMVKVFKSKEGLYEEMRDILDNSITEQKFEVLWPEMMDKYDLHHISCLNDIWDKRKRFVPVYFKNQFFPFIHSTARSEGTNSVFKKGVGPQYSVMSVLNEYHRIIETI
jgi:transposase-like protein